MSKNTYFDYPYSTPRGTYNIDVNHSYGREQTELVARDPILGTWRRLIIREDDLRYVDTYGISPYEKAVRRLEAEMDRAREQVTTPLLDALRGELLDFQARCMAYDLLRMLGLEERVRGMSPWTYYDGYRYDSERDAACDYCRNHPEIEQFEEFCIKIQLQGGKPFYSAWEFRTVREALARVKEHEERLVFEAPTTPYV